MEIVPKVVIACETPAKQIKCKPATFVFELGLIGKYRSTKNLAQVICLYQLCIRNDFSDSLHGQYYGFALNQQGMHEGQAITCMRVPITIQCAKTRCSQWLINWCVTLNPGVASGNCSSKAGKPFSKGWIEKAGMARAAAVMNQPDDRTNTKLAQTVQAFIRPRPIRVLQTIRCDPLPLDRVANCANT